MPILRPQGAEYAPRNARPPRAARAARRSSIKIPILSERSKFIKNYFRCPPTLEIFSRIFAPPRVRNYITGR